MGPELVEQADQARPGEGDRQPMEPAVGCVPAHVVARLGEAGELGQVALEVAQVVGARQWHRPAQGQASTTIRMA